VSNARADGAVAGLAPYRVDAPAPRATRLELGDGWGCAELQDRSRFCWVAPVGPEQESAVLAHPVPWLDDSYTSAGPDRICRRDVDPIRCFRAPEFIRFRDLRARTGKLNDAPESWLLALPGGDGALIDSTPVTHGAFRGCRGGLCWGPYSTLASSSGLTLCHHQQLAVPCAVANEATLRELWEMVRSDSSMIGDLFGCFHDSHGVRCIGASRDGLFGTREACPPTLLKMWPTATGTVVAPNAKCSAKPVYLHEGDAPGNQESASPRGVCFEELANTTARPFEPRPVASPTPAQHCFGPLWLPDLPLQQILLGLGDEPSACGIDTEHRVLCWGAGYSVRGRSPRRVEFALPKVDGVAFGSPGKFPATCASHRNCARVAEPLPTCSGSDTSRRVSAVLKEPKSLEGRLVRVRGELGLSTWSRQPASAAVQTASCPPQPSFPIVLRDGSQQLFIEGLTCSGDRSRLCCNAPALGQAVMVSGLLTWRNAFASQGDAWTLSDTTLCELH
jgi:hypothetical protein